MSLPCSCRKEHFNPEKAVLYNIPPFPLFLAFSLSSLPHFLSMGRSNTSTDHFPCWLIIGPQQESLSAVWMVQISIVTGTYIPKVSLQNYSIYGCLEGSVLHCYTLQLKLLLFSKMKITVPPLGPMTLAVTGLCPGLQYQTRIPSCGANLKTNQKANGHSHKNCDTLASADTPCQACW